ncbi:hypothetical protein LTR27_003939 [Elasticomyces elasticus]|nr:hypothetical protein LTR27_003939 [Elasticomyces elasticus]
MEPTRARKTGSMSRTYADQTFSSSEHLSSTMQEVDGGRQGDMDTEAGRVAMIPFARGSAVPWLFGAAFFQQQQQQHQRDLLRSMILYDWEQIEGCQWSLPQCRRRRRQPSFTHLQPHYPKWNACSFGTIVDTYGLLRTKMAVYVDLLGSMATESLSSSPLRLKIVHRLS